MINFILLQLLSKNIKVLRILVTLKSKEHEKEKESWKGEREEHVIGYTVHVGGLENV